MNILIADDEMLVRMGLKAMFSEPGAAVQYAVFEASNGIQAMELYKACKPLLVFVDITMPLMDGLEFITEAKKLGYGTKFVILTCHDELHFIRKAIKLGVSDYIVKTSMNREDILLLAAEVEKEELNGRDRHPAEVVDEMLLENARANVLRNIVGSGLTDNGMIGELAKRYGLDFLERPFVIIALFSKKLCCHEPFSGKNDVQKNLKATAVNVIKELMNDYHGGYVLERDDRHLLLFPSLPGDCTEEGKREFAEEFCGRLIKSLEMYINADISMGLCLEQCSSELVPGVRKAEDALRLRFYSNHSDFYISSRSGRQRIEVQELENRIDSIAALVGSMGYEDAIKEMENFIIALAGSRPENVDDIYNLFIQLQYIIKQHAACVYQDTDASLLGEFACCSLLNDVDNIFELYEVFKEALKKIACLSSGSREAYYDKIIQKAKTYILEHLDQDTDLETIAGHVNLSPNYFSEVFREKTGGRFIDYVISVRINKAKELISKGEKAYSVMERLGYNNYSYFCRLFKKVTGKNLRHFKTGLYGSRETDTAGL